MELPRLKTQLVMAEVVDASHSTPTVEMTFTITGADDQTLLGGTITVEVACESIEYPEGTEWVDGSGLKRKGI